jgi:protein-S-isoprenylcysteine O-methyltransferase Ste14
MPIGTALRSLWILWIVSWLVAARWRDRAAKRPPVASEIVYRVLILAGSALEFAVIPYTSLARRIWTLPRDIAWTCVAIVPVGMAFAWWARVHLGRLWSSSVTRKADHHVVDTGPYGIVRHPIYTGVIASILATAVVQGSSGAILGAACFVWGFYLKARLEEAFLRAELGEAAYDAYRRRVPMLVPFFGRNNK